MKVHKTSPSRNDIGSNNGFFAFIDEWHSDVELPLNLPKHSYLLSHSPTDVHHLHNEAFTDIRTVSATTKSKARYWLLPYVPFFSNCFDFGSYIYFNDLFETHEYCSLIDTEDTVAIKSFSMFNKPKSDICTLLLQCRYEEDLSFGTNKNIWFSHLSISHLFYMIASPIPYDKYSDINLRNKLIEEIASGYDENEKLSVIVTRDDAKGSWNLHSDVPRDILFNIEYHQMNRNQKRIISASIFLTNFSSWSDGDDYRLNIKWNPMSYYDLINNFAYNIWIYCALFILIAFIQIVMYWIILILHYISRRYVLSIEIIKFCCKLFEPLAISTLFVIPGIVTLLLVIKLVFTTKYMSSVHGYFGEYLISWLDIVPYTYIGDDDDTDFNNITSVGIGGRVGVAFIAVSCFILYHSVYIIIPQPAQQQQQQQADIIIWKRIYWILHAVITIILSTVIVELSLSPIFETQFYPIFVAIKLCQLILNRIFTDSLKEDLLISPFTLSLECAVFAATLSAPDFITFVLGHFIDIFITILEMLYFPPVIDWFIFHLFAVESEREKEKEQQSQVELESISSVVCCTSSHVERFITSVICILFIFILILFRDETALAPSYGIKAREMLFYELFAVIMIIPTILCSIIMINTQGLMYGWNVLSYLEYCQYRYTQRLTRWVGNHPYSDLCIDPTSRSTHDLCFSSQYFVILLFSGIGLLFGLISLQSFVRHNYSPFGDILFFPILLFVLAVCFILMKMHMFCANLFEIYVLQYHHEIKQEFQAPDIDYMTPLQRINQQKDEYKKEYQKIKSPFIITDEFRAEFLKHNRNFIGDHIHSIVSTKMLKKYSNISIIELAKVLGLRNDDICSSDSEDSLSLTTLTNLPVNFKLNKRDIFVTKYLLSIARIRILFKTQLNKYINNTLAINACSLCKIDSDAINIDIRFEKTVDFALDKFRKQYISTKQIDPLHPKLLSSLLNKSTQIIKDWIGFITKDIGYEILCDECFNDKVEDEARMQLSNKIEDPFAQTTKRIAALFLKLAKQKTLHEIQNQNDAISISTISDADDEDEDMMPIPSEKLISSDSESIFQQNSNRSSMTSTTTDSTSFMPQSFPALPPDTDQNVRNLVRAWCWIATLKYERHNK